MDFIESQLEEREKVYYPAIKESLECHIVIGCDPKILID